MTEPAARGPAPRPLRTYLFALVLACVIPSVAVTAILMLEYVRAERAALDSQLLAQSRTLALAIERELRGFEARLEVLAASPEMRKRDWPTFHALASDVAARMGEGVLIALVQNEQLVLTTGRPYGAYIGPPGGPALDAARSGRVQVSDIFTGPATQRPLLGISIPVESGDAGPRFGLSLAVSPQRFSDLLARQRLPEGWLSGIMDGKGRILARSRTPGFVGEPAAKELVAAAAQRDEGIIENVSREGLRLVVGFSRVPGTAWVVRVAADKAVLRAPLGRVVGQLAGAALLMLSVLGAAAYMLARRIAAPIRALASKAHAVGRSDEFSVPGARDLRETAEVADVLESANREIRSAVERQRRADEAANAAAVAEAASQAKSAFLAHVSHEVRTPLAGVIGLADVVLRQEVGPEVRDNLMLLRSTADSLRQLLDDILDFTKLDIGKLSLESIPFDPSAVLSDAVELFRPAATSKGLTLSLATRGLPTRVRGDPLRLRQIILNLVSNAVKFTPEGRIDVVAGASPDGDRLDVRVSDTGVGLAAEERARLFEEFTQANLTIARRYGGTGLGLAICRGLVMAMGGEINVQSTPGVGTTVAFHIRTTPVAADEPSPANTHRRLRRPRPLRVLIVEDNAIMRQLEGAMLRSLGHGVDDAANGREALARLEARRYDVVLMDLRMPELDGHGALSLLRAREGDGPRTPVIAVSAAIEELASKPDDVRFDAVVSKPIDWDVLQDLMATLTGTDDAPEPFAIRKMRTTLGEDAAARLVGDLVKSMRSLGEDMRSQLAASDGDKLSDTLHTLAGLAGTFGCTPIVDAVKESRDSPADARVRRVSAALDEVLAQLGR